MVAPVLTEWASVLVHWLHVIAAIGWIGSSFYFIHLDLSLKRRDDLPPGVKCEAWQVHGGGFCWTAVKKSCGMRTSSISMRYAPMPCRPATQPT